ncbi:MAG: hypothetical protein IJU69_02895 [Bacteroidales bacterium]|nr:hypothetical protein [Bacteroidales bacterium]
METLTRRERQVAELVAWGANRKEVPDMLRNLYGGRLVSIHTVNNILANIYAKLSLNSETELSAWYFCEVHGVDSSLSPLRQLRNTICAVFFLLLLLPQLANIDQAVRPRGSRSARTERVERASRARRGRRDEPLEM